MDALLKALTTEYMRLCDNERKCKVEWEHLPPGSIQKKRINGRVYFYLQYREKTKVKSVYVRQSEVEQVSTQIKKRKAIESELRAIQERKKAVEEVIGKDILNVSVIKLIVSKVIKSYPEITRVILFGSRAGSEYRDNSDVDLLFESSKPISLMKQNEIRLKLEEELGLNVDLVHGPLREDDFLRTEKQIEVYGT